MKKPFILLWFCIFTSVLILNAQQTGNHITISGTVLDVDGTPIEQAMIIVDGKETDIKTDYDGNYTIKVKKDAINIGVIVLGTGVLEEEIDGRYQIDFLLSRELVDMPEFENEYEVAPGEELVNTGYSLIKRKYVVGCVGYLDVEHSKKKYSTIEQILMDTPGLIMLNRMFFVSGAVSNFLQGRLPPLIIIDSTPSDRYDVVPSEVASVSVLNGSAAAIYGSRGMGGVIVITTRIQ